MHGDHLALAAMKSSSSTQMCMPGEVEFVKPLCMLIATVSPPIMNEDTHMHTTIIILKIMMLITLQLQLLLLESLLTLL